MKKFVIFISFLFFLLCTNAQQTLVVANFSCLPPTNLQVEYIHGYLSEDIQMDACLIFDIYGKQVKKISFTEHATVINVSDLSSGLYFIQMKTKQGNLMKKFVKK